MIFALWTTKIFRIQDFWTVSAKQNRKVKRNAVRRLQLFFVFLHVLSYQLTMQMIFDGASLVKNRHPSPYFSDKLKNSIAKLTQKRSVLFAYFSVFIYFCS